MSKPYQHRHAPAFWRSHGNVWRAPALTFAAGILLGLALLYWLDSRRVVPEELGLGVKSWAAPGVYRGQPFKAWKLEEYASVFPADDGRAGDTELSLGNSQLDAINQLRLGRYNVAALHAIEVLSRPRLLS